MSLLELVALCAVAATGLYLLVLGGVAFFAPSRASRFLLGFASSLAAHLLELALRMIAGAAFVLSAHHLWLSVGFSIFGWVLASSVAVASALRRACSATSTPPSQANRLGFPADWCFHTGGGSQCGPRLTAHSSRRRFVARPSSGVRPGITTSLLQFLERRLWSHILDRSRSSHTVLPHPVGHLAQGKSCLSLDTSRCLVCSAQTSVAMVDKPSRYRICVARSR